MAPMAKRPFPGDDEGEEGDLPDDIRCRRTDYRNWRCRRRAMQRGTFCERHNPRPNRKSDLQTLDRSSSSAAKELMRMAANGKAESGAEVRLELPNGVMAISGSPVRGPGNAGVFLDRKLGSGDDCLLRRPIRSKNAEPMPVGTVKKLPMIRGRSQGKSCEGCGEKM